MAELFGFSITRSKKTADPKQSFTQPQADDGTQTIAAGGYFGQYLDMEGQAKTEQDLIRRYRDIAIQPECDSAIEDIVNEAIVANERDQSVEIITDNLVYSSKIKNKIREEFDHVLRLLDFDIKDHDIKNGITKMLYHPTTMIIPIVNAIFNDKIDVNDFYKHNTGSRWHPKEPERSEFHFRFGCS